MRPIIQELLPSMFQRRLLLLLCCAAMVMGILAFQMSRLTVAQGSQLRKEAESALTEGYLIPTIRGAIVDRKNRVLAQDQPTNDIAVQYDVIDGQWAYERAHHEAFIHNRARWPELDFMAREELTSQLQPKYDAQVESLWKTLCAIGHIDRAELEDRIATVKSRVHQIAAYVAVHETPTGPADMDEPEPLRKAAQEIHEQREAHALLNNVDDAAMIEVRTQAAKAEQSSQDSVWKEVSIQPSRQRDYPLETMDVQLTRTGMPTPLRADDPLPVHVEGVGMHILGLMHLVDAQAVHERPFVRDEPTATEDTDMGGYLPGDNMGSWGIERAQEAWLRGTRGQVVVRKDTDEQTSTPPVPGKPVVLSIDIQLQARIQGLMDPSVGLMKVESWQGHDPTVTPGQEPYRPVDGDALNGAAVVIDVATDQVLAAVSSPALSLRRLRTDLTYVLDKVNEPFINRVIDRAYQPGSTVKPLVLAGAITDRKLGYDETITCNGYMDEGHPDRFRCWIFREWGRTHGALNGPEAIENSCNIFFFTMGQRLGVQRLVQWYQTFGLGHPLGCGLEDEVGGSLPNLAHPTAEDLSESTARFLGIGQGPINWTPLQAANAYAALARGGKLMMPTFILSPAPPPQQPLDLNLDPHGVDEALQGLDLVVNGPTGTGSHLTGPGVRGEKIFNCPGIHVRGKSGTADAHPLVVEDNGVKHIVRQGAHSWFIGLISKEGESRPRYAIAVVVEYGGSGGNVAGPVANQIIYALRDEHYL